jgi:hypothetical protein
MALAMCAVMVAPPKWRPLLSAGAGLFTVGVGLSLLSRGAHLPSDVVGGFFVAGPPRCSPYWRGRRDGGRCTTGAHAPRTAARGRRLTCGERPHRDDGDLWARLGDDNRTVAPERVPAPLSRRMRALS